jgi:dolichol-phosphate mannosyltransferase
LFYILNRLLADGEVVMWMGEFAMFTRQVRDAVLTSKTTFASLRAELGYVGFRRTGIPYRRAKRKFGRTHYPLFQMMVYAIGSILAATTMPLRSVFYLAAFVGFGFPVFVIWRGDSAEDITQAGVFAGLYFLLLTVPLIALYLARLYQNGVQRPVFVVDETATYLEGEAPALR